MGGDDEVPVVSDCGQFLKRPEILGLPEFRVDDDDMLIGESQLDAGDENDAPARGIVLELAAEGDDVVVRNGQGVEPPVRGPVDKPLGAEVDVVLRIVACMSVEINLELRNSLTFF
jgi:hypothetical protein